VETINWDKLAEQAKAGGAAGSTELIPPAPYVVLIKSAEAKPSSKGKPQIAVRATVEGGPYAGTVLWNWHTITETDDALAVFFRSMKAYGLDEQYFAQSPTMEQIAREIVGKRVVFVTIHDPYQGELRNKVKFTNPATPAQLAAATAAPTPAAAAPAPPAPAAPPVPQPAAAAPAPAMAPAPPAPPVPQPAPPVPEPAAPQVPPPPSPPPAPPVTPEPEAIAPVLPDQTPPAPAAVESPAEPPAPPF